MKREYHPELVPSTRYHIYNKGAGSRNLFRTEKDYKRFWKNFLKYFQAYFGIYAHCLMPNHFHVLIEIKNPEGNLKFLEQEKTRAAKDYLSGKTSLSDFISDQFRRLLSSHALYFNKKYETSGQVFLKKFKKIKIHSKQHFLNTLCYIHHNLIHHSFTNAYEKWPYSSYNNYSEPNLDIEKIKFLERLGEGDKKQGLEKFHLLHKKYKYKELPDLE